MKFKPGRRNLIAVLDWGLGHASRSLALATRLETGGEVVAFASAGLALKMLRQECPQAVFHELPAYNIGYQSSNMIWNIGRQLPRVLQTIRQEHKALAALLKEQAYERIISDSRFGCYAKDVPNIMLTHQLQPIFGLPLAATIYRWFLTKNFSEFWVPDHPGPRRISGKLSDSNGYENVHYLGPLSRLQVPETIEPEEKHDLIALLSGPEPQRTYLEEIILSALQSGAGSSLIVAGRPGVNENLRPSTTKGGGTITRIAYTNAKQTATYLLGAERIICRSGYSTLMDLNTLGIEADIILVPTPGQTEQEYLAEEWASISPSRVTSVSQQNLATLLGQIIDNQ